MKKIFIRMTLLLAGCVGMLENIKPVSNFQVERYPGKWYEIARLDHSFERGRTSVTAEYSLRPDGGVRVSLVMPGIVISEFQKVAGYNEEFSKGVAHMGKLLEPQAIADGICWLLTQPPHVNVSEMMIRPTGQNNP